MIQIARQLKVPTADGRPTVCHVIHALGVGGAEVLVDQMVRRMSDEFRCVVAVLDEIGPIGERLIEDGFAVELLFRKAGIDRACAKRLRKFADREGAMILHAHQYTPCFQSMLSRGFTGRRPVVFTEHGRHFPDMPGHRRAVANRLLLQRQDRLFGCGDAVRKALIENEGLPADRVELIYNGVDLDVSGTPGSGARERIRSEFGYAHTDFVVVQIARLHALKDHETALRTIQNARRQIPGLRLLIAGDGEQRATIERIIQSESLEENVTLAGTRTDVADLLAASDAFLLTSLSEGIPLTIIEAMAARRPIVATSVGGVPEMIMPGETGFLAPSRDSNSLATALVTLYRNPALRLSMGEAGERRARKCFSLNGMLDGYRRVYREVLSGCRTAKSNDLPAPSFASGHRHSSDTSKFARNRCRSLTVDDMTALDDDPAESQQPVGSLVIFSDDWGRHPSSCQHLTRQLLDRYRVLWVNTIGTRAPRLDLQTARRVAEKLRQWKPPALNPWNSCAAKASGSCGGEANGCRIPVHPNLTVVNPKMWPWFGSNRSRRLNSWLLSKQLISLIEQLPGPVVGLTTLPITADLPGVLPIDRWVYYCVDDFSEWPGLDGDTMRRMDRDMVQRADSIIAVSPQLQAMIAGNGRTSSLLTHGVDVCFWNSPGKTSPVAEAASFGLKSASVGLKSGGLDLERGSVGLEAGRVEQEAGSFCHELMGQEAGTLCHDLGPLSGFPGPRVIFWGVIDRRLDSGSILQLSRDIRTGSIILVGPQQNPDPMVLKQPNVFAMPAQPMSALPAIAQAADVLIMPYSDQPVTRAMQPLKLKEYLATGRPVVVSRLPSTEGWSDCLDIAESPEHFSTLVRNRLTNGLPSSQAVARGRLERESWKSKALLLECVLAGTASCRPCGMPVCIPTGSNGAEGQSTAGRQREWARPVVGGVTQQEQERTDNTR